MPRSTPRFALPSLALAIALATSSCSSYRSVWAPPSPPVGQRVDWPGTPFSEVRAFCYDHTAEPASSFFVDGRMHRGVADPAGVALSPSQVERLLTTLTTSHDRQERTPCYRPHHAFVFYSAAGQPVALFEMCFGCNRFVATPPGLPEYIGYDALYQLASELGLPLGKGDDFYRHACTQIRSSIGL